MGIVADDVHELVVKAADVYYRDRCFREDVTQVFLDALAEIRAYLKRYRKAGSDHSGYYLKNNNNNPSNMEIIEGLVF